MAVYLRLRLSYNLNKDFIVAIILVRDLALVPYTNKNSNHVPYKVGESKLTLKRSDVFSARSALRARVYHFILLLTNDL
jgi:hypothetical protein